MQTCLFSVSYAGYWGQHQLGLEEFIRHAGRLGFEGVMLAGKRPHLSPLDADDRRLERVKDCLAEANVRCAVLGGYTDFSGFGAAEVPSVEMQILYVENLARLAARLGCGLVRVFTAYEKPDAAPGPLWDSVVKALRECCDRAAAHGVAIAIQNHHDVGLSTQSMLALRQEIDRPNCKLGFDAWSPSLCGEDIYESAKQAAPFVAITTNADYQRLPRHHYHAHLVNYSRDPLDLIRAVPFGEGFIDYQAFFQGLRDGGFDGVATYEMCSPIRGGGAQANLDAYCTQYLKWMANHLVTPRQQLVGARS